MCESIPETVTHEVQLDAVFEESFGAGENKCEALGCIERALRGLGLASRKTCVRHADERCVIRLSRENPLDRRGRAIRGPFQNDSGIVVDGFHIHLHGEIVHLPDNLPADFQPAAALAEPKLGRDGGTDKRLEHAFVTNRSARAAVGKGNLHANHAPQE